MRSLIYKWHKLCSEGRETIMDDGRCGCSVSKSKTSDIKLVKHRLDVDRRITMHELFSDMDYRTVRWILDDELNMEWFDQVYPQWIERHRKCIVSQGAYFDKSDMATSFEI